MPGYRQACDLSACDEDGLAQWENGAIFYFAQHAKVPRSAIVASRPASRQPLTSPAIFVRPPPRAACLQLLLALFRLVQVLEACGVVDILHPVRIFLEQHGLSYSFRIILSPAASAVGADNLGPPMDLTGEGVALLCGTAVWSIAVCPPSTSCKPVLKFVP